MRTGNILKASLDQDAKEVIGIEKQKKYLRLAEKRIVG